MAPALFVLDFGRSSRASVEERRVKANPLRADELLRRRIHLTSSFKFEPLDNVILSELIPAFP